MFYHSCLRAGIVRRLCLTVLLLALAGCSALPVLREHRLAVPPEGLPDIVDTSGYLGPEQVRDVLFHLAADDSERQALAAWMIREQYISSQPLVYGNALTLLQDGGESYKAKLAAMEQAERFINMEYYIFDRNGSGRLFLDALEQKQAAGVQVNIIYDGVGTFTMPYSMFDPITRLGGNVLEYRPVRPPHFLFFWFLKPRDHRKQLIIDGETAFIGGINISPVYDPSTGRKHVPRQDRPWRDTDIMIQGPAVHRLQNVFLKTWKQHNRIGLLRRKYLHVAQNRGSGLVRVLADDSYSSERSIYKAYLLAINNAKQTILIQTPYFVPGRKFVRALAAAAKRGVAVHVMLPAYSDTGFVFHAGRSYYAYLIKRGVHLYEYNKSMLHSKVAVVDGIWSTIGSANIDYLSFLHNEELNVVVYGRDFAAKVASMFHADLRHTRKITRQDVRLRPWYNRFMEFFGRLCRYWL